jgi:hypothetical protein
MAKRKKPSKVQKRKGATSRAKARKSKAAKGTKPTVAKAKLKRTPRDSHALLDHLSSDGLAYWSDRLFDPACTEVEETGQAEPGATERSPQKEPQAQYALGCAPRARVPIAP